MSYDKSTFDTPLTRFYNGKTVLITGGTGCVGKVLIEKLLYSCRGIRRVYVLIRPKKGVDAAQRLEDFIKSPVFAGANRIPRNVLKDKIEPIFGDMTLPGLGLSEQEKDILLEEVDIVLHCAASVRFDDPVKEALKINFLGTRSLVELANEMSKVEAFVHVSTAYSNCHLDTIEEKVYPTKISGDELVKLSTRLSSEALDKLAKEQFYDGRPNSYTFTKALAENYVHENSKCPTAIARLAIVTPALDEPEPGFVDTAGAGNFVGLTQGLGAIRTITYDPETVLDGLPVDMVADTLLAIPRELSTTRPPSTKVYHVCAGPEYKCPIGMFFEAGDIVATNFTSFQCFRPVPSFARPPYRLEYLYKKYILEYLFALVYDILLMVIGRKSFALKKMMFVSSVRDALQPFMHKTFTFENKNFLDLCHGLDEGDDELFRLKANIERVLHFLVTVPRLTEFIRNGCTSFMKNKFNDVRSPETEGARRRHYLMLKAREFMSVVVIHAMLIGLIYGAFSFVHSAVGFLF